MIYYKYFTSNLTDFMPYKLLSFYVASCRKILLIVFKVMTD